MPSISKLLEYIGSRLKEGEVEPTHAKLDNGQIIVSGEILSRYQDEILNFDEFKNVKTLNMLPRPIFRADKNGNPIAESETYVGGDVNVIMTETCMINDESLGEVVDLYGLELSPRIYDKQFIEDKFGVWKYPTQYSSSDLTSYEKIVMKYSKKDMRYAVEESGKFKTDDEIDAEVNRRLTKLFTEALDGESNIPYTQAILVRCSPRSFKKKGVEVT